MEIIENNIIFNRYLDFHHFYVQPVKGPEYRIYSGRIEETYYIIFLREGYIFEFKELKKRNIIEKLSHKVDINVAETIVLIIMYDGHLPTLEQELDSIKVEYRVRMINDCYFGIYGGIFDVCAIQTPFVKEKILYVFNSSDDFIYIPEKNYYSFVVNHFYEDKVRESLYKLYDEITVDKLIRLMERYNDRSFSEAHVPGYIPPETINKKGTSV